MNATELIAAAKSAGVDPIKVSRTDYVSPNPMMLIERDRFTKHGLSEPAVMVAAWSVVQESDGSDDGFRQAVSVQKDPMKTYYAVADLRAAGINI